MLALSAVVQKFFDPAMTSYILYLACSTTPKRFKNNLFNGIDFATLIRPVPTIRAACEMHRGAGRAWDGPDLNIS